MSTSDLRDPRDPSGGLRDPSGGLRDPLRDPEEGTKGRGHHKSRSRGLASINPKFTQEVREINLSIN